MLLRVNRSEPAFKTLLANVEQEVNNWIDCDRTRFSNTFSPTRVYTRDN